MTNVLFINYRKLSESLMKHVKEYMCFAWDIYFDFPSEFYPESNQTWASSLTMANIEQWHQDQVSDNGYKGKLKDFIKINRLELEVYIINNFDLHNVDRILIET